MTHVLLIGTGRVARALAGGWRRAGLPVTFASRDPDGASAAEARAAAPGAAVRRAEDVLATADLIVLAVPFAAAAATAAELAAAPKARVVKAFNTMGAEVMADPRLAGRPADLLLAGDDPAANAQVADLARALGFTPVEVGGLALAAELEALARLWIALAVRRGHGRRSAFAWLPEHA